MNAPAAESLVMMRLLLEKEERAYIREEAEFWKTHLSRVFSAPAQPGESKEFADAREMFVRMIDPNGHQEKVYEWNIPQSEIDKVLNETPLLEQ